VGRWLAYYGKPVGLERVLDGPRHALIEQSRPAGIGWYPASGEPEVLTSGEPTGDVESHLFLVHLRASSESPVQPFRHGRWLWIHDGLVRDWPTVEHDLVAAVDPRLRRPDEGASASEVLFLLALTFGLEQDPSGAVERTVGLVEELGRRHGVERVFHGPIAATDGERLWAFRYSSDGSCPPVHYSTRLETLKALYPGDPRLDGFDEETRLVASDPFDDLPGVWSHLPESSWGVVQAGQDQLGTFRPVAPVPA
jgi:predicted glutamine amidotransferase